MTFKLFSDVRETSTAPGTSDFSLNGVYDGSCFAFSDRYSDGDTGHYYAKGAAGREIGIFTFNDLGGGSYSLSRSVIKSTNSDAAVNFSSGTVDIAVTNIAPSDLSAAQLAEMMALYSVPSLIPGGRLTLTSATPVMSTSVAAATQVFYAPHTHAFVPVYDGASRLPYQFTSSATDDVGLTLSLGSNWAANTNYDVFVALDSGTLRLCTGPAWTTNTARGTGAGTTELQICYGLQTNKNSMTCRYSNTSTFTAAANRATYLGTIRTGAAGQTNFILGGTAGGGVAGVLGVWNAFHRLPVTLQVKDSTDSWTYATTGTWRATNNSSSNRVSYVSGLVAEPFAMENCEMASTSSGTNVAAVGVGYDSTTTYSGLTGYMNTTATAAPGRGYFATQSIGYHYMSGIEYVQAGSVDFYGDAAQPTFLQSGITFSGLF